MRGPIRPTGGHDRAPASAACHRPRISTESIAEPITISQMAPNIATQHRPRLLLILSVPQQLWHGR